MNCQEAELLIDDIASNGFKDGKLLPGSGECLAHIHVCESCSAKLLRAKYVSKALNGLALSSAELPSASRSTEEFLRTAFRKHAGPSRRASINPFWKALELPRWSFAAAAILLISIIIPLAIELWGSAKYPDTTTAVTKGNVTTNADEHKRETDKEANNNPAAFHDLAPEIATITPQPGASKGALMKPVQERWEARRRVARLEPQSQMGGVRFGSSERAKEITTDFMPLMAGLDRADVISGRLIRVELPRSALASFGLPMNTELAGERIKADVVMGDDGLAQAIRFVR